MGHGAIFTSPEGKLLTEEKELYGLATRSPVCRSQGFALCQPTDSGKNTATDLVYGVAQYHHLTRKPPPLVTSQHPGVCPLHPELIEITAFARQRSLAGQLP